MAYYSSEAFYNGGDSSLEPDFNDFSNNYGNFTGFNRLKGSQIGFSGNPATGNQLGEVLSAIRQGTKVFEVSLLGIQGDPDQVIPRQHLDEIRALSKLTGVKPSVHGPLMDAAGFTDRGWGGEEIRKQNERRMFDAVERAHVIGPKDNIVVNFHTGNAGGYSTGLVPGPDGKPVVQNKMVINKDTKQINMVENKNKFTPGDPRYLKEGSKGKLWTPDEQIESINKTDWDNNLTELAQYAKHADEILEPARLTMGQYKNDFILEGRNPGDVQIVDPSSGKAKKLSDMNPAEQGQFERMRNASLFLDNVQMNFHSAFEKAFKYGSMEQRDKLRKLSNEYKENIDKMHVGVRDEYGKIVPAKTFWEPVMKRDVLMNMFNKLRKITEDKAPEVYKDASKFAMDQAAKTFGNLACTSYKKYGASSPKIIIENIYEGIGFSTAEDQAGLIEKSRRNFEEYLMKDQKKSKKDAEKIAEKLIGANWDMGHINIAKSKGFDDKYIVEQTKKIAPYVKHVHVTDNFGFNDSHLAPGMGNVPIKEVLEQLEKHGKIEEMQMIVEAGGFINHFKKPAHNLSLTAFGSGIHETGGYETWNQAAGMSGHYFGGFGTINPEIHHSIYGSGFTTMPMDLGGQIPGGQSRFSGNPMA